MIMAEKMTDHDAKNRSPQENWKDRVPAGSSPPSTLRRPSSQHAMETLSDRRKGFDEADATGIVGRRLGPYEIHELLGKGGIGLVFRAFDRRLERWVALKLLRMESPEAAQGLLGEARTQARVEHEHVCQVFEAGEIGGEAYIAMQHIEGTPLSKAFPKMSLREKVEVLAKVAEGIAAAHQKGLIHRDIKPGNIMVVRGERGEWKPYVLDFGLARELSAAGETATGEVKGTPQYMPPEQVTGQIKQLDARADVYSLGATLYEGLVGASLYPDTTGVAVLLRVLNEDPEPLRARSDSVPLDLEAIVMRCLEKNPAKRYATAEALAEDLHRFLDGEPVVARSLTPLDRLVRRLRKRRVAVLVAALVATVVLSIGLFIVSKYRDHERGRLMEKYRQEVRYNDDLLRHVYQAPLHDITDEKKEIRTRLAAIEARAAAEGRLARGPRHYALGRGYLALGEIDQAYEYLRLAWESGTRDPEVAYALGRTLGNLYHRELREAARIVDGVKRQERLREIEAVYRDPALDFLRLSGDVESDSVELVEALIAFWEERYQDALEKSRAAARRVPWLYEAFALEGQIHVSIGLRNSLHGDYESARDAFERAQDNFAAAVERGRSDARIYEGQCHLGAAMTRLASYNLGSSDAELEAYFRYGAEGCERARQVDSERAAPYLNESILLYRMGEHELYQGIDPTKKLVRAAESAQKALERAPALVAAQVARGWAEALLTQWRVDHGGDPWPTGKAALASFGAASKADPGFAEALNGLGYTRWYLGRWQLEHGEDAGESFEAARVALERAVEIDRDYLYAFDNLINVCAWQARWHFLRGEDPMESVERVVETARRMRKVNSNYLWSSAIEGDAWVWMAHHELAMGGDPAAALAAALAAYEEALRIGEDGWIHIGLGRLATVEARWLEALGKDPAARFEAAHGHLDRAAKLTPEDWWVWQSKAERDRHEAAWRRARGGALETMGKVIDAGLANVDAALEINPALTEILAIEGALRLLRTERDAGRTYLERALRENPHLAGRYGPLLGD